MIILFYTYFSTFETFAKEFLKTVCSKPKPRFFEDDDTEDSDATTSETNQGSSDFSDDEEFLAAVESFNRAYSKLYEPVLNTKVPETPRNSPKKISIEPGSSNSTPQLPETQATQKIQCISSDSSETSIITQYRPKKRKIDISDTSDDAESQIDLTRSKGFILGSDDSSTIESVHSSDLDFIDDNDYDPISSDECKKRRKQKRFF